MTVNDPHVIIAAVGLFYLVIGPPLIRGWRRYPHVEEDVRKAMKGKKL